ncbi:MAG: hypothetical protein CMJ95_13740 [Planctomycetes bacterium]|nr:hypothetical protein [Planctomycetota bacterium]|tara:strand:- start:15 stop:206 length:192 start_codon:yes stop_codon:yes gene_type:complete
MTDENKKDKKENKDGKDAKKVDDEQLKDVAGGGARRSTSGPKRPGWMSQEQLEISQDITVIDR